MIALASVIWMVRLGSFLFLRIEKDGKDGRFDHLKKNWFSFLGAWTIQALWVVLIQMPVILINMKVDEAPVTWVDRLMLVTWIFAFIIEVAADVEKFVFRCNPENKGKFITTGTWKYSRHPNYFGEILMWFALAICVTVAD